MVLRTIDPEDYWPLSSRDWWNSSNLVSLFLYIVLKHWYQNLDQSYPGVHYLVTNYIQILAIPMRGLKIKISHVLFLRCSQHWQLLIQAYKLLIFYFFLSRNRFLYSLANFNHSVPKSRRDAIGRKCFLTIKLLYNY